MRPSFEALPMGWTPVGPCSVGCRWCRWCWWICFCAFCIQNVDWQGAIILLQPVSAENIKNSQQCFVPCFSSYLSGVHGWAPIMFTCITHPNVAGCCRSHTSAWSGIDAIVTTSNCLSPSSPEGHQNTLGSSRQRPKLFQIETCQRKQLKQIRSQNQKCCSVSWKKL